jgi:hypothetical protein
MMLSKKAVIFGFKLSKIVMQSDSKREWILKSWQLTIVENRTAARPSCPNNLFNSLRHEFQSGNGDSLYSKIFVSSRAT